MLQFDPTGKDMPHFVIPFVFPSLNEYLAECGKNPRAGGKIKRDYTMYACNAIRRYLRRWKAAKPIIIHYHFYEENRKRDHDNVFCMASKCIQDALIKTLVIKNDGWNQIENFTHDFFVADTKKDARIEVWIEEVE